LLVLELAIHVSLDSSSGLNKETVFNQCMSHVKKSLESISTRYEELHSKLQQEEKNRKVLLARLRKHRAELSETLSRRSLVDQTLESNRKEMQLLASQVSELEKQSKSAGEAYSLLKKATDDAMHSYERRILDLEGEISKLENDEEYMNLRRNRKVLANEVKWLRESIDRKVLDRDRVRMNLDRVRGVLFDSSSK
jgi:chromosome segregation ATPase